MKYTLFALLFLLPSLSAEAHVPVPVGEVSEQHVTEITDPILSQAFYGRLTGYPHSFEIRQDEPFTLHVELMLPDAEGGSEKLSSIIIQETGSRGRVTEIARLLGEDATWEVWEERWGGDTYRKGGSFTKELPAGVYRIEVSTPENHTPYVLVVGTREEWGGYFDTVARLASMKAFFGKSPLAVIESPLVYVPLSIIALGMFAYWYRRRTPHVI